MEAADQIRDKLHNVSQRMRGSGTTFVDARDLLTAINLGLELYGLLTKLETQMNDFVEKTHAESAGKTEGPVNRRVKPPRGSPEANSENAIGPTGADSGSGAEE